MQKESLQVQVIAQKDAPKKEDSRTNKSRGMQPRVDPLNKACRRGPKGCEKAKEEEIIEEQWLSDAKEDLLEAKER
eukprot:scaffold320172_cov25-Prasinocladus_malaysianus.AAC.1